MLSLVFDGKVHVFSTFIISESISDFPNSCHVCLISVVLPFSLLMSRQGVVRNWFDNKGFGFIISNENLESGKATADLFVHRNALTNCTHLQPGQHVLFEQGWTYQKRSYQAEAVVVVE